MATAFFKRRLASTEPLRRPNATYDTRGSTTVSRTRSDKSTRGLLATMSPGDVCPFASQDFCDTRRFTADVQTQYQEKDNSDEDISDPAATKVFIDELLSEAKHDGMRDTPIFIVVSGRYRRMKPKKKQQHLIGVLIHGTASDINRQITNGMTALHLAIEIRDFKSVNALLAFGANVNLLDNNGKTPLDLLMTDSKDLECTVYEEPLATKQNQQQFDKKTLDERLKFVKILISAGAVRGEAVLKLTIFSPVKIFPHTSSEFDSCQILSYLDKVVIRYSKLKKETNKAMDEDGDFTPEEAISFKLQMRELCTFKKAGSRILFLDGGGVRGLIQIQILSQIEEATGRRITELFDWIVGTSTGGIMALALVYRKRSLPELRQLYFRLKNEIFGNSRGGVFNTKKLECIYKHELPDDMYMESTKYPRVLITAVDKSDYRPELRCFNNCFGDQYCRNRKVWKVARCTSAAPWLFGEYEGFVDGGILANNPSVDGLAAIQDHFRARGLELPISLVVSVGCGIQPAHSLGNVNPQDMLYPDADWLEAATSLASRTANLKRLLTSAITETEENAKKARILCASQGIKYFRFNPLLKEELHSEETDDDLLLRTMLHTSQDIKKMQELKELVTYFHNSTDASKKFQRASNHV